MSSTIIVPAIEEMRILEFKYKGAWRVVEPHALGYNEKQRLTLCGWQLSGGSGVGFRDFHVEIIDELMVSNEVFDKARKGYNPNDPTLSNVIAKI